MTLVLAIDTAMAATSVGLTGPGVELQAHDLPSPGERPAHAAAVLPLASRLLEEAGEDWHSIDRVAVGIGPGSFTGLRIGIAAAKGIARGASAELVGVSTLAALLAGSGQSVPVAALIDGKRGEVFALWSETGAVPVAIERGEWGALPAGAVCVGDGALLERDALIGAGFEVPEVSDPRHVVDPAVLVRLSGDPGAAGPAEPIYLRDADAIPTAERGNSS